MLTVTLELLPLLQNNLFSNSPSHRFVSLIYSLLPQLFNQYFFNIEILLDIPQRSNLPTVHLFQFYCILPSFILSPLLHLQLFLISAPIFLPLSPLSLTPSVLTLYSPSLYLYLTSSSFNFHFIPFTLFYNLLLHSFLFISLLPYSFPHHNSPTLY